MNTRDDLPPETTFPSNASAAAWLIHYAARRAPEDLAERLEEEWIAHLGEQQGFLSRLRFALGCCWATEVIGYEPHLYGARLSAAGHSRLAVINPLHSSPLPRRAAVLLVIVFLHIAAALALIYAIRAHDLPVPQPQMTGKVVFDLTPITPPPPLPRAQLDQNVERIPALPPLGLPQSSFTDAPQPIALPASSPPAPGPAAVRRTGGIGKGFPDAVDYYPSAAIRLSEAGVTAVGVCVDDRGRLSNDPRIAVSSGSPRLDSAALAVARAGSGHYRSTTENGKPISACFQIGVRFALKN